MTETVEHRVDPDRVTGPQNTWRRVAPMLPRFGITRVADLTRLDDIGVPVHAAYRPTGLGYAVSMGTGPTAAHARVGAVMESIENWHAENVRLPVAVRGPAVDVDPGYDVRLLPLAPRSPLTASVVLDWVPGHGLLTGRDVLVPLDAVRIDGTRPRDWPTVLFRPTSEGMAVGNTETEAVLHGLLEAVERASLTAARGRPRRAVDPASCRDPDTTRIRTALHAAGCSVAVRDITGPTGLPCFVATVWSPDVPLRCTGHACHPRADVAVGKALGEAVLTRLAAVSGARDDIDGGDYRVMRPPAAAVDPAPVRADVPDGPADLAALVAHCASLVAQVSGHEPFAVRLGHDDLGIPAVKVVAPGLRTGWGP